MAETLEDIIAADEARAAKMRPKLPEGLEDIANAPLEAPPLSYGERLRKMGEKDFGGVGEVMEKAPILRPIKRGLETIASGFNEQFARTAGFPVELVNEALEYASKAAGDNVAMERGTATQAVRDALKLFGVKTLNRESEGLLEKIGEEGFRQMLGLGVLRGAAPSLTAPSRAPLSPGVPGAPPVGGIGPPQPGTLPGVGPGVTTPVARTGIGETGVLLGRSVMEKPITAAAAATGASVGVPIGHEAGSIVGGAAAPFLTEDPATADAIKAAGATMGEFKGGMVGSGTAAWLAGKLHFIPKYERPYSPQAPRSVVDYTADPELARAQTGKQLERALTAIDKQLLDNIDAVKTRSVSPGVDSKMLSVELKTRIERVKDSARAIQKDAYEKVDKALPIKPPNTITAIMDIEQNTNALPDSIPSEWLNGLKKLLKFEVSPSGNVTYAPPTFGDLNKWRGGIQAERWNTQATTPGGRALNLDYRDNLSKLEQAIFKDFEENLGDGVDAWRFASKLTTQLNDRFTRGPIGALLGLDRQATDRVAPEATLDFLLRPKSGGMQAIQSAGDYLPSRASYVDPKTGKTVIGTRPEGVDDMNDATSAGIRSMFAEAAQRGYDAQYGRPGEKAKGSAQAAQAWFKQAEGDIKNFTRVSRDIKNAITDNEKILIQRQQWEDGAFAQYHARPTKAAAAHLLDSANAGPDTRMLINGLRRADGTRDEDAIQGLGKAMMEHLLTTSKTPGELRGMLTNSRMRPALVAAWGEDGLARAERIIQATEHGVLLDIQAAKGPVRTVAGVIAGVMANWAGHAAALASPSGGYGNLRYPAQMAKAASQIIENAYQVGDPMRLIKEGIYNPTAEALLLTRLPSNISENYQFHKRLRSFLTLQEMLYNRTVKGFTDRYSPPAEEEPDSSMKGAP